MPFFFSDISIFINTRTVVFKNSRILFIYRVRLMKVATNKTSTREQHGNTRLILLELSCQIFLKKNVSVLFDFAEKSLIGNI